MTDLRALTRSELADTLAGVADDATYGHLTNKRLHEAARRLREDGARIAELEAHIVSEHARNVAYVAKFRTRLDAASVRLGESMDARDELVARMSSLESALEDSVLCARMQAARNAELQSVLANVERIAERMEEPYDPRGSTSAAYWSHFWAAKLRGAVK